MKNQSPARRQPLKRSRIKKRPRSRSERERIYGPKGYVEWIHEQPCVGCGFVPSSCAHIKTGGTGRKADWTQTVPLCETHYGEVGCHPQFHLWGRDRFEGVMLLDLNVAAKATQAAWLSFSGGSPKTGKEN